MEGLEKRANDLGIPYSELLRYPKLADIIVNYDESQAMIEDLKSYLLNIASRFEMHDYRTGSPNKRKPVFESLAQHPMPRFETFEAYDIHMTRLEHRSLNISSGLGAWIYAASHYMAKQIRSHYPHFECMRNEKLDLLDASCGNLPIQPTASLEQNNIQTPHEEKITVCTKATSETLLHFVEMNEEMSQRYNASCVLTVVSYKNHMLYRYLVKEEFNGFGTNAAVIDIGTYLSKEVWEELRAMIPSNILLLDQKHGVDVLLLDTEDSSTEAFKQLCVAMATQLIKRTGKIVTICFAKMLTSKHISIAS